MGELCIDIPLDGEFSKTSTPQLKKSAPARHVPAWRELLLPLHDLATLRQVERRSTINRE
jgi:hypothetical protein